MIRALLGFVLRHRHQPPAVGWSHEPRLPLMGFRQPRGGLWRLEMPRFLDPVPPMPVWNWMALTTLALAVVAALVLQQAWLLPLLPLQLIDWILASEAAVGKGHPVLPDIDNRPLRQVLTDSGCNPDAAFTGFAGPIVNVRARAFGAMGDDVTDDTAAIQTALNACPDGGILDFGPFSYRIAGTITCANRVGLTVKNGRLHFDPGVTALTVSDSDRIRIYDLEIDGGGTNAGRAILINAPAANNLHVHVVRCTIRRCKTGIETAGVNTHDVRVIDCDFIGNADEAGAIGLLAGANDGIYGCNVIQGYATSVRLNASGQQLLGNHFYRNPSTVMTAGVSVNAANTIVIDGNYFDGFPTNGDLVIEECITTRGMSVVGNTFLNTTTGGAFIHFKAAGGGTNIFDIAIEGNTFISTVATKTNGIVLDANVTTTGSRGFFLRGNTWRNATRWSNSLEDVSEPAFGAALVVDGMHGCTIMVGTLTGNITISNPTDAMTGGIANRIRFVFRQDGTGGRTVSFDSEWSHAFSNVGNAAGKVSCIEFVRDNNLQWIQAGAQSPYV